MAGEHQQVPGNGVDRPVIPLQNTEEAIEIIEEDATPPARSDPQHVPGDERAGSYEYEPEGGEAEGTDSRLSHFRQDAAAGEQPQPGETQEQLTARQRRRNREKEARQRERTELVRLRQENMALKQGHQQIDARLTNVEKSGIDAQIQSLETELSRADLVMKRALEAQNGEDFVTAQNIRDTFRDRLNALKQQKSHIAAPQQGQVPQGQAAQRGVPGAPQLTQQQVAYSRIFVSRHPWYKHGGNDRDTQAVVSLDNEMMAEGLNPTTPEYWVELERRVQEDLPHRFQSNSGPGNEPGGQQPSQGQNRNNRGNAGNGRASGGPRLPGAGGGGSGAGGAPLKFHLSKDRKQSLIDLGVYGTPEQDRYIKSFMKWDREHPEGN